MLQSKDTEWLNGFLKETHKYAAYKRFTSDLSIYTD